MSFHIFKLFVSSIVIAALPLHAQIATAELSGIITDATGAVVANAKVQLVNTETGQTIREVTSDSAGNYTATFLPPATYNITVEASGFRKTIQNNVKLDVSQRARLDFSMQLGQVSETVEVTAAAPLLESQSSSLGSVIGTRFVQELPLNGRNFVQLAILSPGVNGTGFSVGGTIMSGTRPDDRRPGTEIFSNGNREGSNNFLYDGVDNNDRLTLSIVLRPGVEAIKEFKVQTNLYSADQGRNSGAQVDVITKSGTNEFHGSMFEFLRNSGLDARAFFNRRGTTFPPFRLNQFGFSFGGPVLIPKLYNGKNRTFFFVDYEGYRRNLVNSVNTTIPTVAMRQGDFSGQPNLIFDPLSTRSNGAGGFIRDQFAGNRIPMNRWDPVSAKLMNAYPTPQTTGLTNNYLAQLNLTQNWNQGDVRVDHQITPNDQFFIRWAIQHTTTTAPYTFPAVQIPGVSRAVGIGNEDSFAGPAFNPTQHAVATYTKVISPRLVNDLRVGANRFVLDYTSEGAVDGGALGNELGVRNSNTHPLQSNFPIFSPAGYTGIGHSRSLPIFRRLNTYQVGDSLNYISGSHTLKFGGQFIRRQITEYQTNRGNGRFNFSPAFTDSRQGSGGHSMASFLLGYANLIEQDFTLAWTGQRGVEWGLYFADDWKATKKLTLNLGMRWEYYSPYTEVANRLANFDPVTATMRVAGVDGVDSRMGVQRDFRNFAPRFGFAYQVAKHTVLRGGYGLFYNPSGNGGAALRLFRHTPFGPVISQQPGDVNVGTRVSDGFPAPPVIDLNAAKNPTGIVYGVSGDFRSAYAQQYNMTLQQEIAPWSALLKVAYVGNLGRRLSTTININQPFPAATGTPASRRAYFGVRPGLSDIILAVSDGLSSYQALQITFDKRYSGGLSTLFAYTWGHAIDNVATDFGGGVGTPQDVRNRAAERGNANFDLRHRMTASATYDLPFGKGRRMLDRGGVPNLILGGWQINTIATLQTGLPYTPGLLNPSNTNGAGGSRPDRVGSGVLDSSARSLDRWFDVSAFTSVSGFRFGNAGRNILFGPGRVNFDSSLFKNFAVRESWSVQFRAEAFNLFNTPQFGQPNATIGDPNAGRITSIVGNPRQLQLALKFLF